MHNLFKSVDAIFLDMNGTFMFDHDRFGDHEEYFETYRALGGKSLNPACVSDMVNQVIGHMDPLYTAGDPACFPSVAEVLSERFAEDISAKERQLVEAVIACHELGEIPDGCLKALRLLGVDYPLVIVSNLWSSSDRWRTYLNSRVGNSLFANLVFSSDIGLIKPHLGIFKAALKIADVEPHRVVMIGDDLHRDIHPARVMGMKTVWVTPDQSDINPAAGDADLVVSSLNQLTE